MSRGTRKALALAAAAGLVVLLVLLTFRPALSAELVSFDDPDNLVHNTAWRGLGAQQLAWMWSASHMGHYHPLTWMSFGLDWVAGAGAGPRAGAPTAGPAPDPAVLHRTSVWLHALTAVAVLLALRRLLALASGLPSRACNFGALAGALFFALHPLRVESVAWVTERRDVLSGLFFVLALFAWLRFAARGVESEAVPRAVSGRASPLAALALAAGAVVACSLAVELPGDGPRLSWGVAGPAGLALSIVLLAGSALVAARVTTERAGAAGAASLLAAVGLLLLSLLAKAWGIVMPALFLVLDVWPLRRARGGASAWRLVAEKAPFLALTLVFARLATWAQAGAGEALRSLGEHGLGQRLVQALYGLAWYPARTVAPLGLAPIYALPRELSLGEPRFALPALAVLVATTALVALRRRWPGALAAWVAFAVIVSPVLGLAQSGPQLVADRYGYLACLPFAALFGWGLGALAAGPRPRPAVAAVLGVGVLALLAVGAHARSKDWRSSTALWEAAFEVNPGDPLTLLSLGSARIDAAADEPDPARGRALLEEALALLERGGRGAPGPRFLGNRARAHARLARLDPARADEHHRQAVELARRALEAAGDDPAERARHELNLGAALLSAGRPAEALAPLASAVEAWPGELGARLDYGVALALAGRQAQALEQLEAAVALAPRSAEAWGKLGEARRAAGDRAGAIEAFRRVLALEPGHAAAAARLEALRAAGGSTLDGE